MFKNITNCRDKRRRENFKDGKGLNNAQVSYLADDSRDDHHFRHLFKQQEEYVHSKHELEKRQLLQKISIYHTFIYLSCRIFLLAKDFFKVIFLKDNQQILLFIVNIIQLIKMGWVYFNAIKLIFTRVIHQITFFVVEEYSSTNSARQQRPAANTYNG